MTEQNGALPSRTGQNGVLPGQDRMWYPGTGYAWTGYGAGSTPQAGLSFSMELLRLQVLVDAFYRLRGFIFFLKKGRQDMFVHCCFKV